MASKRNSRLQAYLSCQYIDFDLNNPTKRLTSLYSDFSKLAILNQYGYDANVSYWKSLILDCNMQGLLGSNNYRLVFNANELPDQFLRPGIGKPLALDSVVNEMIQSGDIITLKQFNEVYALPTTKSSSWYSWFTQKSQQWLLPSYYGSHIEDESYVVIPTIKEIAKGILRSYIEEPSTNSSASTLLTFNDFRSRYGTDGERSLTDGDIWLLLRYMYSELGVALADDVQGYGATHVVIKFPYKNQVGTQATTIDQQDRAIVSIRTTCSALHSQVDELQQKAEEYTISAKEHYAEGRKSQALYAFKKKKHLLEILDRRLKSLETMETLLMKIEASQNDLQVVQAFNIGADALRSILSNQNLSVDTVDEAMLNVQQAFQDQKEVEDAIVDGVDQANRLNIEEDDEDLEKELAELEEQEQEQQKRMLFLQKEQEQEQRPVREISPPPRHITQSAPPPSPAESELARINDIFGKLKKVQSPPSKIPSSALASTKKFDRHPVEERQLEPAI
ncbi:Snf7-domain-containing protein [Circinella umbellata]|nr:Snf7-domain-containing protein [Circinella umbellata]